MIDPIFAILSWAFDVYRRLEREDRVVWEMESGPIEWTESTSGVRFKKVVYRRSTSKQPALDQIEIAVFDDGRVEAILFTDKTEDYDPYEEHDFSMKLLGAGLNFALAQIGFPAWVSIEPDKIIAHPPSFFCRDLAYDQLPTWWHEPSLKDMLLQHEPVAPEVGNDVGSRDLEVPDAPEAAEEDAERARRENDNDPEQEP